MYWFRNAIIYQLTKQIDFESIEKQLKECEFTPCESADDMDEYENYESNDLPYAVYGVVLGKAECKKKTLTEEEKDERCSDFDYVLEKPEIVDYPKDDDWIKCSERLPGEYESVIVFTPPDDVRAAWLRYDDKCEKGYYFTDINIPYDFVTHWQPLPPPPTE